LIWRIRNFTELWVVTPGNKVDQCLLALLNYEKISKLHLSVAALSPQKLRDQPATPREYRKLLSEYNITEDKIGKALKIAREINVDPGFLCYSQIKGVDIITAVAFLQRNDEHPVDLRVPWIKLPAFREEV
jgi:hypothetical protein